MTARSATTLPDPARPDAAVQMFSTWRTGTPERRRAAVDAIAATWEKRSWPTPDLLSYNVYAASDDDDTLLHYSQWTSEAAYHAFVGTHREDRNAEIDAAVPGIERVGINSYEPYRRSELAGATGVPGCVVIVDVEFDGPDPQRLRDWVDGVFEALGSDAPQPGGISANFFLAKDGARVLNYAEWTDEQAHIDAVGSPGTGVGSLTEEWRRVRQFPGVKEGGFKRYRLAWSASAPATA